jgi:mannose-6-phosphate isomerase-like protein (cupin superfamily)
MDLLSHHYSEDRPWGSFEEFTMNEPTTVKILHVSAGKRFSLQKHAHRSEYWKVIEGNGIAQTNDVTREVKVGDEIEIPIGTLHRLTGGENGIKVLEISFGKFEESDITRTEDDFGRVVQVPLQELPAPE